MLVDCRKRGLNRVGCRTPRREGVRRVQVVTATELAPALLERAESVRRFLTARIPPRFRSTISADDVLQEAWIAAFRHSGDVASRDVATLNSWVFSIAERKLVDALRRAKSLKRGGRGLRFSVSRSGGSAAVALFDRLAANRTPSQCLSAREAADAVLVALSCLNDEQRRAIQLRHLEGLSLEQTAAAMNKSQSAVSSLLFRGLRRLRSAMGTAARYFSDVRSSESSTTSVARSRGTSHAAGVAIQPGARR